MWNWWRGACRTGWRTPRPSALWGPASATCTTTAWWTRHVLDAIWWALQAEDCTQSPQYHQARHLRVLSLSQLVGRRSSMCHTLHVYRLVVSSTGLSVYVFGVYVLAVVASDPGSSLAHHPRLSHLLSLPHLRSIKSSSISSISVFSKPGFIYIHLCLSVSAPGFSNTIVTPWALNAMSTRGRRLWAFPPLLQGTRSLHCSCVKKEDQDV